MTEFTFVESDADGTSTGRSLSASAESIAPLGWDALVNRRLAVPAPIDLAVTAARVTSSSIPGIPVGESVDVGATISPMLTTLHIGLVRGGWRPVGLGHDMGSLIIPDRCTLSELKGRFKPGRPTKLASDFIDHFKDRPVKINPAMIALEGNTRGVPTDEQIVDQVHEACAKLRQLLPTAEVIGDGEEQIASLLSVAQELRPASERAVEFLASVAPLLKSDIGAGRLTSVREQLATQAQRCGVETSSILFMCVLSAACVRGPRNPARSALKFTVQSYSASDAYNAMADVRGLQIFAMLLSLMPDESPVLCTGDKDLALVWLGLRLGGFRRIVGQNLGYGVDPQPAFLPPGAMEFLARLTAATVPSPTGRLPHAQATEPGCQDAQGEG